MAEKKTSKTSKAATSTVTVDASFIPPPVHVPRKLSYTERQREWLAHGVGPGDTVEVVARYENEEGWKNAWHGDLTEDRFNSEKFKIVEVSDDYGLRLQSVTNEAEKKDGTTFYVPFTSVRPIGQITPKKTVPLGTVGTSSNVAHITPETLSVTYGGHDYTYSTEKLDADLWKKLDALEELKIAARKIPEALMDKITKAGLTLKGPDLPSVIGTSSVVLSDDPNHAYPIGSLSGDKFAVGCYEIRLTSLRAIRKAIKEVRGLAAAGKIKPKKN